MSDLSREEFLKRLKGISTELPLKSLGNGYAAFCGTIPLQHDPKTKAHYRVTCRVPLSNPMFHSDGVVETIRPSAYPDWIQYSFWKFTDNNGFPILN